MEENILTKLTQEMTRHKLQQKTRSLYVMWIERLIVYTKTTTIRIDTEHAQEYLDHLTRREKLSAQTVHQAAHAIVFFMKNVLDKSISHESFTLPNRAESSKEIVTLSQSETLALLSATNRAQDHLALCLAYGTGMEISELTNLRVKDINLQTNIISIRDNNNKAYRATALPMAIKDELISFIETRKPKTWLFESKSKPGTPLQSRPFQRAFRRAAAVIGIDNSHSFRSLRYAYVVHMQEHGIPLGSIGSHLKLSASTIHKWLRIGKNGRQVLFSPLDKLQAQSTHPGQDVNYLRESLTSITNSDILDHLNEAIDCYSIGAIRAAIIFFWNAAMITIQNHCKTHSIEEINNQLLTKSHPNKTIKNIDEIEMLKDSVILDLALRLGIYDRNIKNVLMECLGLRNKCGHPGQYRPGEKKILAFFEDITKHVFLI